MHGYEALRELSRERRERLAREARAERLACEARGSERRRRKRLAPAGGLEQLLRARREAARLRAGT